MCKILIVPSIQPETEELAWKFAKEMGQIMSEGNKDGMGYMAITGEGDLFGERWHINSEAFDNRTVLSSFDARIISQSGGFLNKPAANRYSKFGSVRENNVRSLALHTRFATSGKQFINTHPFVDGVTALIHNGIISNLGKNDLKQSTCDSEKILNEYVKHQVMLNPQKIQKVAQNLNGYYACAIFSKNSEGTPILDVFKCEYASLSAAWIRELNTLVITTSMSDVVKAINKIGNMTVTSFFTVSAGVMLRFNALTGHIITAQKFKPRGWSPSKMSYNHGNYSYGNPYRGYNYGHDGYTHPPYSSDGAKKGSDEDTNNLPAADPSKVLRVVAEGESSKDGWLYNRNTKTWKKRA